MCCLRNSKKHSKTVKIPTNKHNAQLFPKGQQEGGAVELSSQEHLLCFQMRSYCMCLQDTFQIKDWTRSLFAQRRRREAQNLVRDGPAILCIHTTATTTPYTLHMLWLYCSIMGGGGGSHLIQCPASQMGDFRSILDLKKEEEEEDCISCLKILRKGNVCSFQNICM